MLAFQMLNTGQILILLQRKHHTNKTDVCIAGSLLTVIGRATFTSSRTVEVEVNVDVETIQTFASQTKERAVHAYFNFVSLDKQRKTLQVPPLKV